MRLLVLASLSASVLATHPLHRAHKRNSTATKTLAHLQYHAPRALIDTCISLDADAALKLATTVPPLASVLSDTCLCLNDLNLFLESNNDIHVLGIDSIIGLLTEIITSPGSKQCSALPPHARRACRSDDPCHWSCENNFTREGDICVCSAPRAICNGICSETCGPFPSSVPRSKKKLEIKTLAQAKSNCKASESVCGIPGREGSFDFECINIDNSLDSCGGCVAPHPFVGQPRPSGKDCSKISNAMEVECIERSCVVHRCKEGFQPNETRGACIRSRMEKYRKRADPITTDAVVYADTELLGKLTAIFNLVFQLKQDYSMLSWSGIDVDDKRRFTWSAVYPVLQSFAAVLTSPEVASLVTNTNSLLDILLASSKKLNDYEYVDDFGLHGLVADLNLILTATVDLNHWLGDSSIGTIVSSVTAHNSSSENANVNNSANMPIVLGLSRLLNELGLGIVKADVSIGGLGAGLSGLVNTLLDGLGIGPNGVSRRSNANFAVSLDALLDAVLRLVLHTNTVIESSESTRNLTYQVLREYVRDVVQTIGTLVDAIRDGKSTTLDLSSLIDSSDMAIRLLEARQQGSQLVPIILDLNQVKGLLSGMNGSSVSTIHADNVLDLNSLLNELGIKGLQIDAAATSLGLDVNLGLSLNSMLAASGL
ncbi:hypothetical protein APHAL10511_007993 [Amanita phalloides]|nr:hypothetical protein APHAL10511_007993 [Amanita phalloides]